MAAGRPPATGDRAEQETQLMPTIPRFDPPGGLTAFSPSHLGEWGTRLRRCFDDHVRAAGQQAGGTSPSYHPRATPTDPPVATTVIRRKRFPLNIQANH